MKDANQHVIAKSLQLIAGRTDQENNQCKQRKVAFWGGRYHATAIAYDGHLLRYQVYIAVDMIRTGVVQHFAEWAHSSYLDIQQPPKRYRIIKIPALVEQVGFNDITRMQQRFRQWLNEELTMNNSIRKKAWWKV